MHKLNALTVICSLTLSSFAFSTQVPASYTIPLRQIKISNNASDHEAVSFARSSDGIKLMAYHVWDKYQNIYNFLSVDKGETWERLQFKLLAYSSRSGSAIPVQLDHQFQ